MCGEGEARGGEPASRPAALTVPAPDAQRPRETSVRNAARRCAGAAGCAAALSPSRLAHGAPRGAPAAVGPPTPYVSPPRPPRGGGAVRRALGRRRAGTGDGVRSHRGAPGRGSGPGQGTRLRNGGGRWALVGGTQSLPGRPRGEALHLGVRRQGASGAPIPSSPAPSPRSGAPPLSCALPGLLGQLPGRCLPGPAEGVQATRAGQGWRWHPRAAPAHTTGLSQPVKGLSAGECCLQAPCSQPGPCNHFALTLD